MVFLFYFIFFSLRCNEPFTLNALALSGPPIPPPLPASFGFPAQLAFVPSAKIVNGKHLDYVCLTPSQF